MNNLAKINRICEISI